MITKFVEEFNSCVNANSAIEYMVSLKEQYPSLKYKDRNGAYVWNNYYILPSYTPKESEFITNLSKNLQVVNPICKTSSPELVDIAETQDKKFSAIIYKINGSNNADLLPYLETEGATQEKIELFKSEQKQLLDKTGLYNPEIFSATEHFYLTSDTGNIIFDNWGNLTLSDNPKEVLHKLNCLL